MILFEHAIEFLRIFQQCTLWAVHDEKVIRNPIYDEDSKRCDANVGGSNDFGALD